MAVRPAHTTMKSSVQRPEGTVLQPDQQRDAHKRNRRDFGQGETGWWELTSQACNKLGPIDDSHHEWDNDSRSVLGQDQGSRKLGQHVTCVEQTDSGTLLVSFCKLLDAPIERRSCACLPAYPQLERWLRWIYCQSWLCAATYRSR